MSSMMRLLFAVWGSVVALTVLGLLLIVSSQTLDRYVTVWHDSPEEYVKIGLTWLCFLGFALALKDGTEIRVDLADRFLPATARRWIYAAFDVALLALIGVVVIKSWTVFLISGDQLITGTDLTAAWPAGAMLVAFVLMFFVIAWRLVRRVRGDEATGSHHF
jgi:TRAP-type C4-dicarboxylate transport system permease small subunit